MVVCLSVMVERCWGDWSFYLVANVGNLIFGLPSFLGNDTMKQIQRRRWLWRRWLWRRWRCIWWWWRIHSWIESTQHRFLEGTVGPLRKELLLGTSSRHRTQRARSRSLESLQTHFRQGNGRSQACIDVRRSIHARVYPQ